jgi:hypothetical protein
MNRFRQVRNRFLGSLKGLQIQALYGTKYIYLEYLSVRPLVQLEPLTPSPPSECVPPGSKGGGDTLACRYERVGGGGGGLNSDDWRKSLEPVFVNVYGADESIPGLLKRFTSTLYSFYSVLYYIIPCPTNEIATQ